MRKFRTPGFMKLPPECDTPGFKEFLKRLGYVESKGPQTLFDVKMISVKPMEVPQSLCFFLGLDSKMVKKMDNRTAEVWDEDTKKFGEPIPFDDLKAGDIFRLREITGEIVDEGTIYEVCKAVTAVRDHLFLIANPNRGEPFDLEEENHE